MRFCPNSRQTSNAPSQTSKSFTGRMFGNYNTPTQGATVKIEVNGTKRGLLGESEVRDLCPKAQARRVLIDKAGAGLSERDRLFLLSFEQGAPLWEHCVSGDLSHFPAVQWKIQNIQKLKARNPLKHQEGVKKLADFLGITSTSV